MDADIEMQPVGDTPKRQRSTSTSSSKPVPPGAKDAIKVMVAVDASSGAQAAFVRAVELCEKNKNPNTMLYILAARALRPQLAPVAFNYDAASIAQEQKEEERLRQLVSLYEEQLKGFNVRRRTFVDHLVKNGLLTFSLQFRYKSLIARGDDVRQAIVKRASELQVDLLVTGRRGVSTLKRYLGFCLKPFRTLSFTNWAGWCHRMWAGSTSQYCAENASCSVLIAVDKD